MVAVMPYWSEASWLDLKYFSQMFYLNKSINKRDKINKTLKVNSLDFQGPRKTTEPCKGYWDIIMFTPPDSISKLLVAVLPAGQRAAYPDWAFAWRLWCSDINHIAGTLFLAAAPLLLVPEEAARPHARAVPEIYQKVVFFQHILGWAQHLFISAKCCGGEAPLLLRMHKRGQ